MFVGWITIFLWCSYGYLISLWAPPRDCVSGEVQRRSKDITGQENIRNDDWEEKTQGKLVGALEPWNFMTFQYCEKSSQLTNSIIFQRGRYTTNQKKSYDFPIGFSNEVQVLERVPLIFAFHKHGSFTLRARPGIARGTDKNWGQRYPRQTKISPDRFGGFHVSSTPILGVKLPYKFPCPFWWL